MKRTIAAVAVCLFAFASHGAGGGLASTRPGWLGLFFAYHPPAGSNNARGWMWVKSTVPGGPAAVAGLRPQDVIVGMDGKELSFANDAALLMALSRVAPGQRVTLNVVRGHARLALPIVAGSMTDEQFRRWQHNFEIAQRARPPAGPQ